jgi:hypothetical protein
VTPLFSRIGFPQIVGLVLLGAMVAAGAGTICLLPVPAAPLHSAGCHPSRVPANPQPADFRCCVSRHPSALTTSVFSTRPGMQTSAAYTVGASVVPSYGDAILAATSRPGSPPGVLILRI